MDIGAFERPTTIGSPTVYTVNATTTTGTGSGNSGDLVYVIEQADADANLAGSIIQFDPTVFGTAQTITLSSTLELAEPSGPMMIEGPGASLLTISGGNAVQVFQVGGGAVVTLSGMTISEGSAAGSLGGAIEEQNFGTLTVQQSTVSDSSAYDGGGIASGDGTLSIIDSTLSGDTAANYGGG